MNDWQQQGEISIQKQVPHPILVVDDDQNLRKTIQWVLEEEGFATQAAADGQEAVEWIREWQPALIVLDMGLPLLDGGEVATHVYDQYGASVPIVLITADGHAEEKSQHIKASAFLRKPFDIDELIDTVQSVLKQ